MRASVSRRLLPQLAVLGNDSRATERRGCAFEPMSSQIYAILARAALVSCSVNARSVSVRMLPCDPTP